MTRPGEVYHIEYTHMIDVSLSISQSVRLFTTASGLYRRRNLERLVDVRAYDTNLEARAKLTVQSITTYLMYGVDMASPRLTRRTLVWCILSDF